MNPATSTPVLNGTQFEAHMPIAPTPQAEHGSPFALAARQQPRQPVLGLQAGNFGANRFTAQAASNFTGGGVWGNGQTGSLFNFGAGPTPAAIAPTAIGAER